MVVAQAEVVIPGTRAGVAVVAVVVGAFDGDVAVDGDEGTGQVEAERGGAQAVGADEAGAVIPPFFRPSRPVCWAAAARAWA